MTEKKKGAMPIQDARPDALSELIDHLSVLDHEVRHVRERARALLEERWAAHHTDIFPKICDWKNRLGLSWSHAFTLHAGVLRGEPLLSDGAASGLESVDLVRGTDALAAVYGSDGAQACLFALAAQEMQFCFSSGLCVLPLAFFDATVGLFVASKPGLAVSDYEDVAQESERLLGRIRDAVLSGRIGKMQRNLQAG